MIGDKTVENLARTTAVAVQPNDENFVFVKTGIKYTIA
jgi:hypothetical protein